MVQRAELLVDKAFGSSDSNGKVCLIVGYMVIRVSILGKELVL